jgi:hypothetical protein
MQQLELVRSISIVSVILFPENLISVNCSAGNARSAVSLSNISRSNALDCCLVSQTLRLLLYEQASRYLDRRLQMLRDEVLTDTSLRL